jgi:iron(III) transport system substrate-binding protein
MKHRHPSINRRDALAAISLSTLALAAGCSPSGSPTDIVLYSSADDELLRIVIDAFTAKTGLRVRTAGDTEATKNTGLVMRLLAEKDRPRADVWWSSEPLGTIRLHREGVLTPYSSPAAESAPGGWPASMKAEDQSWYAFAARARVIVFNTNRYPTSGPPAPRTLRDLTNPELKGRVGMARPQFGTTGAHMAFLAASFGEPALTAWLHAMKSNDLRLYDGNSTVVRAASQGEIAVGLTDTDDAFVAARNTWPVGWHYESVDSPETRAALAPDALPSLGPLLLPNTVGLIKGGPNPTGGQALIDFLLSADCERLIARTESRNLPIRPGLATEFPELAVPSPAPSDLHALANAQARALELCTSILG